MARLDRYRADSVKSGPVNLYLQHHAQRLLLADGPCMRLKPDPESPGREILFWRHASLSLLELGDSRVFGQLRYLLVDGRVRDKRENLIGLLFALERAGEKEFQPLVERLARRLRGKEHAELRRSFQAWLKEVLIAKRYEGRVQCSLEDDMIHLPERISWLEEARLEARQEGLEKGRLDLARSIFQRRFGPLSEDALRRLHRADPEQLAIWAERSFSCRTLDEVFETSE